MANEDDETDIDIQIVADSYRVMLDPSAWDDLIHAWDKKLWAAGYSSGPLWSEAALEKHYGILRRLLMCIGMPDSNEPITRAAESVREPAMVITRKMRVVAVSQAGRKAFGASPGQIATLAWLNPKHQPEFREALSKLQWTHQFNNAYRIVSIQGPEGSSGFAELFPIRAEDLDQPVLAVRALAIEWTAGVNGVLTEAFGLTEAECEVARLLFLYVDLAQIAAAREVNVKTIRVQASHIFAKTDTKSQAELIRLLAYVTTRVNAQMPPKALRWSDPTRGNRSCCVRTTGGWPIPGLGQRTARRSSSCQASQTVISTQMRLRIHSRRMA